MHETHQLAHEPASVAVARHELRDLLEREGVGESVVYDATLVLSELVWRDVLGDLARVMHGRVRGLVGVRPFALDKCLLSFGVLPLPLGDELM